MKRSLVLVAVFFAFGSGTGSAVHAQSADGPPSLAEATNLLDLWMDAQIAYGRIPGASAAVVHDQDVIWSAGYGFANLEDRIPASPSTRYSICSISKLFTSIAVMQQRDAGRLRLDDPVSKHLPWFNITNSYPDAGVPTIAGLLTHSAGLPRESDHPYWTGPDFEFPTREQMMHGVSQQETLYPASTYFQYSNLGLSLAGEIAAAVSETPYQDLIQTGILDPLALSHTTSEIPRELWGNELAVGYSEIGRAGERKRVLPFMARGIAPAAGFASTVEDLGRFASWQFRALEGRGDGVLAANTLREMHRVHWVDPDFETHWGWGFSTWRSDDKTFVGHGGACPGYLSHLAIQVDEKIATAFATNALGVNTRQYTQRAYEIIAPALREPDSPEPLQADDDRPNLGRYTGTYGSSFGGEIAVLQWKGALATITFPTNDPLESLTRLRHIEGDTFARVRSNDQLGETLVFEIEAGQAVRFVRHNNRYERIDAP